MGQKMEKRYLVFLFVLASTLGFSQSANTVIKTRENENPRYTEIFYVLKSDTSVRHGSYQRLGFNDEIILSGNYRDGKKDSLWVEFLRFSTIILSKGFYRDGEKIGIWEYYDNKGQIQLKYNYDNKQSVYCRKVEEGNVSEMFVKLDTGVVSLRLQRDPFFNGDDSQLWKFLSSNIKYPVRSYQAGVTGTVYVAFFIDPNGHAFGQRILRGISEELNQEALRVVKLIPDDWIAGITDGKLITAQYHIPVRFTIKK